MTRIHITVDLEDAIKNEMIRRQQDYEIHGQDVDKVWVEALQWVLHQSVAELDE